MISKNDRTSDPGRLLPNLSDKIDFKGSDKYAALPNLSTFYKKKNIKKSVDQSH